MTGLLKGIAAICVLVVAGAAFADSVTYTGNTETSADGSWMRPDADFTMIDTGTVLYSVQSFNVTADGLYDITSIQGLDSNGAQFDGFIFLYASSFDPVDQLSNGVAGDDDGAGGTGTSDLLDVNLSAGTTYFLVTSAFDPGSTAFGSGSGPFSNTIEGPGDVLLDGAPVPLPAALWLMLSAVAGLRLIRRT